MDIEIGERTRIRDHVNLYKCRIGRNCKIHPNVYIEKDVVIGDDWKVQPFAGIGKGNKIGNGVNVGPNVMITTVKYPFTNVVAIVPATIDDDVAIGGSAVILPGVRVGTGALKEAGAIVTRDVPAKTVVVGNPARVLRKLESYPLFCSG